MISIVIPAFNEAKIIGRCLSGLISSQQQQNTKTENYKLAASKTNEKIEIIVVCNGCTDNTAEVANRVMPSAKIMIIDKASKTTALNVGINKSYFDTVVLLDADITFSASDLENMLGRVKETNALIASPKSHIDLTDASYWVRAYYNVTKKLPYYQSLKISAVIMLTKAGKERLGNIPKLIADDRYIQLQFKAEEQLIVDELTYRITPPSNVTDLIKILTRSHLGNMELIEKFPELKKQIQSGHSRPLFKLIRRCKISSLLVFILIKLIVRVRARIQFRNIRKYQWEKDESSR